MYNYIYIYIYCYAPLRHDGKPQLSRWDGKNRENIARIWATAMTATSNFTTGYALGFFQGCPAKRFDVRKKLASRYKDGKVGQWGWCKDMQLDVFALAFSQQQISLSSQLSSWAMTLTIWRLDAVPWSMKPLLKMGRRWAIFFGSSTKDDCIPGQVVGMNKAMFYDWISNNAQLILQEMREGSREN